MYHYVCVITMHSRRFAVRKETLNTLHTSYRKAHVPPQMTHRSGLLDPWSTNTTYVTAGSEKPKRHFAFPRVPNAQSCREQTWGENEEPNTLAHDSDQYTNEEQHVVNFVHIIWKKKSS